MSSLDVADPLAAGHGPVDVAEVERAVACAAASRPLITAAFLFGSQVSGAARARSDIDIGVWLSRYSLDDDLDDIDLTMAGEIGDRLGRNDIEVVILNPVDIGLRYAATNEGMAVYEREPGAALGVICRVFKEWVDTAELVAKERARVASCMTR